MALNFIEDLSITGNVGLPDDSQVQLGNLSGGDMKLYYVSGIGSYVLNKTDDLRIINQANDKDIIFETDDGSGSTTPYITLDGSAENISLAKNTIHPDAVYTYWGNSNDFYIGHTGSSTVIINSGSAGHVEFSQYDLDKCIYFKANDGSGDVTNYIKIDGSQEYTQFDKPARMMDNVYLQFGNSNDSDIYHNGTDMFIRNYSDDGKIRFFCDDGSGGIEEYFYLDGSSGGSQPFTVWPDSAVAVWGNGHDLRIEHDGTYSTIDNYTGDFEITNYHDDGDLSLRSDNGSGGTKTYLRLDGGVVSMIGYTDLLFGDALYLKFGDSQDFVIGHDSSNSKIENNTGHLYIMNEADDKDIIFQSDDGSGGTATYFYLDGGNTRTQFNKDTRHVDSIKAMFGTGDDGQIYVTSDDLYIDQTTADKDIILRADAGDGSTATYMTFDGSQTNIHTEVDFRIYDSKKLQLGNGADFEAFHDGSHMYMQNDTGDWYITQAAADEDMIFRADNGVGSATTYFYLDGSLADTNYTYTRWNDGGVISLGTGMDLRLWHDPSTEHSYIRNYTNDFIIESTADDKDIIFKCDDGSGGVTEYFKLDGGWADGTYTYTVWPDNSIITLGAGADLQIYHDGSNSYINDTGTGNLLFQSGGSTRFSIGGDVGVIGSTDFFIPQGRKLLLDGVGGHTYIEEESDGNLKFYVSGNQELLLTDSLAQFENQVWIPEQIYHIGDSNTYFGFHNNDEWRVVAGGTEILEVSSSGIKLTSSGSTVNTILDEDNMASDSATALATQQSIKAYVDNKVTGVLSYQGTWNANTNTPTLSSGSGTPGYYYIVSVAGSTDLDGITDWAAGDWAVFSDLATDAWQKIDNTTVGDVSVGSGAASSRVSYWSGTTTIAGTAGFTFDGSNLAVPGNITLGGGLTATGDLTVDCAGDIILDADGGDIKLKDAAVAKLTISMQGAGDTYFVNETNNADILFKGVDDTSTITALTLDFSEAGHATFNDGITVGNDIYMPQYIRHIGDTTTYFGFYTDDTIVFNVAGSEAMRIDANGDVGIGTTDPLKKLHIVGPDGVSGSTSGNSDTALLIDNDGSNGAIIELMASNDSKGSIFFTDEDASNRGGIIYGHTNDELIFKTAATNAVTIGSSQAVTFANNIDVQGNSATIGSSSQTTTTLNLTATNTAGSPANAIEVIMTGYEGRGIGHFYKDTSYSGEEWFSGLRYSGAFANWAVGYDASGGQAEYAANSLLTIYKTGAATFANTLASKDLTVTSSGDSTYFGNFLASTGSAYAKFYQDSNSHLALYMAATGGTANVVLASSGVSYIKGGNLIVGGSSDSGETLQVEGTAAIAGITSITAGGSSSPSGVEGLHLMYDSNHAYIKSENNGTTNRPLTFLSSAYTFSVGDATFVGNVVLDDASGAAPQVQWINGSDDTGAMYLNSSGKLQIVTGGSLRQEISSGSTEFTGACMPSADSTYNLGHTSYYWANAYIDAITTTGAVTVGDVINMPNNKGVTWTGGSIRVESSVLKLVGDSGIQLQDNTTITGGSLSITGDGSNAATLTETGAGLLTIAAVDDIVIDAASDIILDADGNDIRFYDGGSQYGKFRRDGGNFRIYNTGDNKDIEFWGLDDSSDITALTLDMSEAGYAIFNDGATFAGTLTIPSYIYHTSDPSDDTYFGFSGNDTFVVYTAGGKGIEIDSNRDVTITGELYGPNGTKAIPTYSFTNDTDTGMYLEGTGNMAFTAGGSATLTLESTAVTAKTNIVLDAADIQLDTAVSASTSSGTIIKFGSTLSMSAGQVVYGSNSMGSLVWGATDADTGTKNILGLALGTSPTSDGILLNGIYHSASHGFTVGLPLYISTTGGEMTTTAPSGSGDYVRVVGYAIDANHIYFCPDNTWIEIS